MPDELRSALEQIAKDNGRSLNAEIVMRLQSTLDPAASEHEATDRVAALEQRVAALERQVQALTAAERRK